MLEELKEVERGKPTSLDPDNFHLLCRTCLGATSLVSMNNIKSSEDITFLQKWISSEEQYEAKMPQNICKPCVLFIGDAYNFFKKVQVNQDSLIKAIKAAEEILQKEEEIIILLENEKEDKPCVEETEKQNLEPFENLESNNASEGETLELFFKEAQIISEEDIKEGFKYPFTCKACRLGFEERSLLLAHQNRTKHKGTLYCCPYCGKTEFDRSFERFRAHLCSHTKEKVHTCSICKAAFSDASVFSRHKRTMHASDNLFGCKYCGHVSKRSDNIAAHERTCQSSKKTKVTKEKQKRSGQEKLVCTECGKSIERRLYENHMRNHALGPAICDECGKECRSYLTLKHHKNYMHSEDKFKCSLCEFSAKTKANLEKHVHEYHEGQEPPSYICEHCNKVFADKAYHKLHLKIHNNDTTYQCHICELVCISKNRLEQHVRTHTKHRPHQCPECDKKFASKNSYKFHLKAHKKEPPTHLCTLCPKGFYLKCYLKRHLQTHREDGQLNKDSAETTKDDNKDGSEVDILGIVQEEECVEMTEDESGDEEEGDQIEDRYSLLKNIFQRTN